MASGSENVSLWGYEALADYTSNSEFEYDDPDKDYDWLDNDYYSLTPDNASEISVPTTSSSNNVREFMFDYTALQNVRTITNTQSNVEDKLT